MWRSGRLWQKRNMGFWDKSALQGIRNIDKRKEETELRATVDKYLHDVQGVEAYLSMGTEGADWVLAAIEIESLRKERVIVWDSPCNLLIYHVRSVNSMLALITFSALWTGRIFGSKNRSRFKTNARNMGSNKGILPPGAGCTACRAAYGEGQLSLILRLFAVWGYIMYDRNRSRWSRFGGFLSIIRKRTRKDRFIGSKLQKATSSILWREQKQRKQNVYYTKTGKGVDQVMSGVRWKTMRGRQNGRRYFPHNLRHLLPEPLWVEKGHWNWPIS